MNCFFALAVAALLVCVSAHHDGKMDFRPVCFRNMTQDEEKAKILVLKTCRDGLTEDQKKDKKTKMQSILRCFMKTNNMINENGQIVAATVDEKIEKFGIQEFKQALKDLSKKCLATPKAEDYFKCIKENKKDLLCKCHEHHHHHHHHHDGNSKVGEQECEMPEDGDIPV